MVLITSTGASGERRGCDSSICDSLMTGGRGGRRGLRNGGRGGSCPFARALALLFVVDLPFVVVFLFAAAAANLGDERILADVILVADKGVAGGHHH